MVPELLPEGAQLGLSFNRCEGERHEPIRSDYEPQAQRAGTLQARHMPWRIGVPSGGWSATRKIRAAGQLVLNPVCVENPVHGMLSVPSGSCLFASWVSAG
jgi:hypothetical protein